MKSGRRFVAILVPIILFAGYRVLTGLPESGALEPATPVFTVQLNGEAVAYPFDILRQWRAVNDIIGGQPIVIFWTRDATARGAAAAFTSNLDGQLSSTTDKRLGWTRRLMVDSPHARYQLP